ncbi:MAG: DegT/DnrJ/EryC1/StrS aminotransferase [Acidobacteriales bacterium]|nr:DegT/DnrJ/EryC1/StrS aminotransferase [Terriglobales bacterium]
MNDNYIAFHRPSVGLEEEEAVKQVLASKWLTTGPVARRFEQEFASYIGCRHAIAVNSATAALQLAFDAIGLSPKDEVLVPSYTFTASAAVITHFGAQPILCDSVPGGFNIDIKDAEKRVSERTRAILPVHIAGEPCEMEDIHRFAKKFNLHVVEDAAHALPSGYKGNRIGTTSALTAFSFYATKTITTGEGGMLTTDNDEYAERACSMRLHGISGDAWKRYAKEGSWYYEVLDAGYKLNMCDLLASIGAAQLRKCDSFHERRSAIAAKYRAAFEGMDELENPPATANDIQHGWHLFILRICRYALRVDRATFIDELRQMGIGTSVHFIPLHLHPYYRDRYGYVEGDFPNAEDAYSRCISLPIYPDMNEFEVGRVINAVKKVVQLNRKSALIAA